MLRPQYRHRDVDHTLKLAANFCPFLISVPTYTNSMIFNFSLFIFTLCRWIIFTWRWDTPADLCTFPLKRTDLTPCGLWRRKSDRCFTNEVQSQGVKILAIFGCITGSRQIDFFESNGKLAGAAVALIRVTLFFHQPPATSHQNWPQEKTNHVSAVD